jgi:beta-phosphoglucomutase
MTSIKGLIFDLDGVIVDTAKFHYTAWKSLSEKLHIPFSDDENEKLKGVGRSESLDMILSWAKMEMSGSEKEVLLKEKNDHYCKLISKMHASDILPGVMNFLNLAKASKLKLAIGSSSRNAPVILKSVGLYDFFDVIVDGNKITNSKPDPEVFNKAASELGLEKSECIVFEDALSGVESAINAGIKCIGVGDSDILKNADIVIPGFENQDLSLLKF